MKKYGIDFNLSKHLEALLIHKSVTLAAKEVGITQPAMSNSFSKIREHFRDPILVKTKEGYTLTTLGSSLLPKVQKLMNHFEKVFMSNDDLNPNEDKITFSIAVSDYAGYVFGPDLLFHLQEHFPNVTVNLFPLEENLSLSALSQGKADLALVTTFDQRFPKALKSDKFNSDFFGVAGCEKYLEKKADLSFKDYIDGTHFLTLPRGLDIEVIDRELEKQGENRNIVNTVPNFAVAIRSILRTTHLISLPYKVLEESARFIPIKVFPMPFELDQIHNSMLWHGKVENDKANIWMRELIKTLFS